MEYFKRQIDLWGEDTQKSLENKHIIIVGSGGLGCSLGYALGSSGIGNISIVDFDTVSIHNIHRQIGFDLNDCGKFKVDVLCDRLKSRYNQANIKGYKMSFEEFIQDYDFATVDLIIDATDNLFVRQQIDRFAKSISVCWIYGSVEEFNGQICFFDKGSFEDSFAVAQTQPKGITAPMVMQIASLQANIALRYLAGLPISKDMLHYIFFDKFGELQIQKFNI